MNKVNFFIILICALMSKGISAHAQKITNYVKNGDFEQYDVCPYDSFNTVHYAKYWSSIDTARTYKKTYCFPEYLNECNPGGFYNMTVPRSADWYQYPHSGKGMMYGYFFSDESTPPRPFDFPIRDYLQGRLHRKLIAGKTYCVSFYLVMAEVSAYAINMMGTYFDDGSIDTVSHCNKVTHVRPQVFGRKPIEDTTNWTKVEGVFTASGTESFITLGNFFPNDSVTYYDPFLTFRGQAAYYLVDDISVVESDLKADAGKDNWVALGGTVKIGRVGDSTATAIDCKWYHKGSLLDSGAIITVKANAVAGKIDTYVVVQSVCGNTTTDTVLVKTTPVGVNEVSFKNDFSIYPNPSNGIFYISPMQSLQAATVKVFDLLGRKVLEQSADFSSGRVGVDLSGRRGIFVVEISEQSTVLFREKALLE